MLKQTARQEIVVHEKIDAAAEVIKGLVRGLGLRAILTGLHNAFNHGEILKECNVDFTQEQLEQLYSYLEPLSALGRRLEGWQPKLAFLPRRPVIRGLVLPDLMRQNLKTKVNIMASRAVNGKVVFVTAAWRAGHTNLAIPVAYKYPLPAVETKKGTFLILNPSAEMEDGKEVKVKTSEGSLFALLVA
jgi:hypothetical protein